MCYTKSYLFTLTRVDRSKHIVKQQDPGGRFGGINAFEWGHIVVNGMKKKSSND